MRLSKPVQLLSTTAEHWPARAKQSYPRGVLFNWAVSERTELGCARVCSSKAAGNRSTFGWPAELSIGATVRPVCCRWRKPLNFPAKVGPTPHGGRCSVEKITEFTGRPAQICRPTRRTYVRTYSCTRTWEFGIKHLEQNLNCRRAMT